MTHLRRARPPPRLQKEGSMLDVLGLDATEEGAYRRLVALPSASAEDLAEVMTSPVSALATALSALEDKGLVARSTSQPGHFVASPPSLTAPAPMSSTSYAAPAPWPTGSPRCSAARPRRSWRW